MKEKTCEEYVLNESKRTQQELELAKKRIEELETPKMQPVEETKEDDMQCIYLSDKPNYWYSVNVKSAWNWNKILKDNKKTPKFVEEALTDDNKLKKLCNLKEKDSWRSEIGCVDERIYNYLLKGRNDIYSVIEARKDDTNLYNITGRENNFLNKEEALTRLKEKVIKEAEYYLRNYKDKFEEE